MGKRSLTSAGRTPAPASATSTATTSQPSLTGPPKLILIHTANGNWACKVDGVEYVLRLPVREHRLLSLLGTLRRRHPKTEITLSPASTENPYLKYEIRDSTARGFWDWGVIDEALLHHVATTCSRCGGPTWWDPAIKGDHCLKCYGKWIGSELVYEPPADPADKWSDEAATLPKPTIPCRNGHLDPAWYPFDQRWICRTCGETYRKPSRAHVPVWRGF